MVIFLYLLAGFALIVLLISILPLKLRVSYGREGERDQLLLEIVVWPGIKYSYRVVMIDIKNSLEGAILRFKAGAKKDEKDYPLKEKKITPAVALDFLKQISAWTEVLISIKPAIKYIMSRTELSELKWKTVYGFNDPYSTGMASGLIWSVKGVIVSVICNYIKPSAPPALSVMPSFSRSGFMVSFNCIFITKTGHIISTGLRALAMLVLNGSFLEIIKMAKRAGRRDGYGRTSNRGINENSHGEHQGNG
ncbi:MAG: DUF2953 domain-containing protein [Bacillota bacterium]